MEEKMNGKIRKREEMMEGDMEEGFTLIEAMASLIVLSVLFLVSVGAIGAIKDRSASEAVVTTFQTVSSEARSRAISEWVNFGLVFDDSEGTVTVRLYRDCDGDGVTRDDINRKIDRPVCPAEKLANEGSSIALPRGVKEDPSGKPLKGQDAVRFGSGDILTFTPKATATPGTLYVMQGVSDDGWAVRVAGIDGRIRIYRLKNGEWDEYCRW